MRDDRRAPDGPDHGAGRTRRILRALTTHRRSGVLAALAAAVALGLAGCGGPVSGGVANVTTTSGAGRADAAGSATTTPKDNPAQLLVEWADCMRRHGDPSQSDPTIDAHGGINIFIPSEAISLSNAVHNGTAPCNGYLAAASSALRAGATDLQPPDQGALVKYSQCMRANGVPNYPDPGTGGTTNFNGTGIDPNSPFVERANNICGKRIHAPSWWISGAGPPGNVSVQSGPSCGGSPCRPGNRGASDGNVAPRRVAPVPATDG